MNYKFTKKIIVLLLVMTVAFTSVATPFGYSTGSDDGYGEPISIKDGEFNHTERLKKGKFDYDDMYFSESSYKGYNKDLAKTSVRLALSAYRKIEENDGIKTYDKAFENVEKMLADMKFTEISHNDWYEKKPERDSIAVATGMKKVKYPNGNFTLISVAICGGNYEKEWAGNFEVGTEKLHSGFKKARDQVVNHIQDYISEKQIKGDVKLWITGYSRAAATANLTGAYLDENPNILSENINLLPENIYTYCFEPAAPTSDENMKDKLYDNIYSVVNQHDFVPMVVPRAWNYGKYGKEMFLPAKQTSYKYDKPLPDGLLSKVKVLYKEYSGLDYTVDDFTDYYPISGFVTGVFEKKSDGQGIILDEAAEKLADALESPEKYTKEFQDAFMAIFEVILGNEESREAFANKFLEELVKKGIGSERPPEKPEITGEIIKEVLKDTFAEFGIDLSDSVIEALVQLVIDIGFEGIYTLVKNSGRIGEGHYHELCIAWLDSVDESDFFDKTLRDVYEDGTVKILGLSEDVEMKAEKLYGNIILAYYKDNRLIKVEITTPKVEIVANPPVEYEKMSVFWWDGLEKFIPMCDAKNINKN